MTPADVHAGNHKAKRREVQALRAQESLRRDLPPWTWSYWQVLQSSVKVGQMSSGELLTKLAFFCASPLRKIARRNREFAAGLPDPVPLRE